MRRKVVVLAVLLLAIGLVLAACSQTPEQVPGPAPDVSQVECPECPTCPEALACPEPVVCPEAEPCPEPDMAARVPFWDEWVSSMHNATDSEAFRHWDEDDPKMVPENCAKCHSAPGYLDFLGADGSEAAVVNAPASVDTTINCIACHNDVTIHKTSVVFPSGIEIADLGDESRCMECHQGRESKVSVDASIENAGLTEDVDTVSADLGFRNIHYFAAAATQYGAETKGGYEYDGESYDTKFFHVEDYNTCQGCHNQHTLEIRLEECQACHADVASVEDFKMVRMAGSEADYDGDGNVKEGVMEEIAGLQEALYGAIQAYGAEVSGSAIVYDTSAYPYFFDDAGESYAAWTPRLLKAGYNYQVSNKDPGEFAHNGKYIIQLLYDSIEDLNQAIAEPVDMSAMQRIDAGHFAGSQEAFRHWDGEGVVPSGCVKCHQADGLPQFVAEGVNTSMAPSNGFNCTTCHTSFEDYALLEIAEVEFPSGAVVTMTDPASNLCISCHQGRSWSGAVDARSEGLDEDAIPENALSFLNVHYFAAGATLFGGEVQGAYQYPDNEYVGKFAHVGGFDNCTNCHNTHELEVKTDQCFTCHAGKETVEDIRMAPTDWDGDGDAEEGIAGEIAHYAEKVYAAMQDYASNVAGTGIVYNPASYPYFFDEAGERYAAWTPRLLKAAYNYQYVQKDPGAFAHNGKYVIQFMYDTLASLGEAADVDMTGLVRP